MIASKNQVLSFSSQDEKLKFLIKTKRNYKRLVLMLRLLSFISLLSTILIAISVSCLVRNYTGGSYVELDYEGNVLDNNNLGNNLQFRIASDAASGEHSRLPGPESALAGPQYQQARSQQARPVSGRDDYASNDDNDDDDENQIAYGGRLVPGQAQLIGDDDERPSKDDKLTLAARLLVARQASESEESAKAEIYLLEDKDYPKSVFEDKAAKRLGQVSGIATMPMDNDKYELAVFHRAGRHWNESTFNETTKRIALERPQDNLIAEDTILILDHEGNSLKSFGSNLFYMPHSIASDNLGNLWVSDVGRHQVMRLPAMNIQRAPNLAPTNKDYINSYDNSSTKQATTHIWPDIILGEAFVPGNDVGHFCQPSEIVVSSNGQLVYVADGYCNQRVMVFSGTTGKFIMALGERDNIQVVHSLTLIEEKNLLCVADRENHRILCYNAGLNGELARLGQAYHQLNYPIGRVFAVAAMSPDHMLVSSNQAGTNRYNLAVLKPFTHELKLVWTSTDLLEPHSLAVTADRQCVYVADVSSYSYKKVFKFHIIRRMFQLP